jgi:hypothetical protein
MYHVYVIVPEYVPGRYYIRNGVTPEKIRVLFWLRNKSRGLQFAQVGNIPPGDALQPLRGRSAIHTLYVSEGANLPNREQEPDQIETKKRNGRDDSARDHDREERTGGLPQTPDGVSTQRLRRKNSSWSAGTRCAAWVLLGPVARAVGVSGKDRVGRCCG